MNLSKKNKDELRNGILELLKEVPEGQLVQIDKDILEGLLFETITVSEEKNIQVKVPVWSGEFLSKIDLSQVDFTNVSWSLLGIDYSDELSGELYEKDYMWNIFNTLDEKKRLTLAQQLKKTILDQFELNEDYVVWYAGTNAKIDLSKSFEAIQGEEISIRLCNFEGLDFSHQDLSNIKKIFIDCSKLSGTKLPVSNIPLYAMYSYLNGIDLSTKKIYASGYLTGTNRSLIGCCLTDCKVQITLDIEEFRDETILKEYLKEAIKENLVGCYYVNGKKILSQEEKEANAQNAKTRRQEYEEMKNETFSLILGNIEKQVRSMKRKL